MQRSNGHRCSHSCRVRQQNSSPENTRMIHRAPRYLWSTAATTCFVLSKQQWFPSGHRSKAILLGARHFCLCPLSSYYYQGAEWQPGKHSSSAQLPLISPYKGLRMKGIWFPCLAHPDKHSQQAGVRVPEASTEAFPHLTKMFLLILYVLNYLVDRIWAGQPRHIRHPSNPRPFETNIWLLLAAGGSFHNIPYSAQWLCLHVKGNCVSPLCT